jgi:uncharacterized protein YukE
MTAKHRTLSIVIIFSFAMPSLVLAGYSSMCASFASDLESAATRYNRVKSDFESAKSNFESSCGPFGFAKNDEFACGQFGYAREEYRSAADELENATRRLKSAMNDVSSSCGITDENQRYLRAFVMATKENEELQKKVKQLENELQQYREMSKPTEESSSSVR